MHDPFREARKNNGVQITEFNGEKIPFVLRLKDLRKTVKDWQSFSSDHPFKVVPFGRESAINETDTDRNGSSGSHGFSKIVEPFFLNAPTENDYMLDMARRLVRWLRMHLRNLKLKLFMNLHFLSSARP